MKKNIGLLSVILFMLVISLQAVEPVAAAKLVDHGTIKGTDHDVGYYKYSWVTYQKGTSYVKTSWYLYFGVIKDSSKETFILQKVSKTKLKITKYMDGTKLVTEYHYTKLTAAQYYWRVFRPNILRGP